MSLDAISAGTRAPVPLALIGGDAALTAEVQEALADIGLLDPPVDKLFGAVSHWALRALLTRMGSPSKPMLDASLAKALLAPDRDARFPLRTPDTLAGRIAGAMQAAGHWMNRHPDCVNIVYIEGMRPDGSPNDDAPDAFNDLRLLLRVNRAGTPEIAACWEATSEPGVFHTKIKRLDPRGAARIAFGQYKAWSVGTHGLGRPSAHEALVQVREIPVFRDFNEDFERQGDPVDIGMFGINQHWGYDLPVNAIGNASAGCLVGRTRPGHRDFMAAVKADPRYVASQGYRFLTTVMPAAMVVR